MKKKYQEEKTCACCGKKMYVLHPSRWAYKKKKGKEEKDQPESEGNERDIREDRNLRKWFTEEQISVMAEAAEDHRASSDHEPRSIYGRIVAEADRCIDPMTIIQRTVQFGLDHYPELSREEHYRRMVAHLHEKYGRSGYLKLWFSDSPNARRLEELRNMMDDEALLHKLFDLWIG